VENPAAWDRLTGALACIRVPWYARHVAADEIWLFLVDDGLVRDDAHHRARFSTLYTDIHRAYYAKGGGHEQLGGSLALRIAKAVTAAGFALPEAAQLDPDGRRAEQRVEQWRRARFGRAVNAKLSCSLCGARIWILVQSPRHIEGDEPPPFPCPVCDGVPRWSVLEGWPPTE
jgi:hypothetical protein